MARPGELKIRPRSPVSGRAPRPGESDAVVLDVRVVPRASRSAIAGTRDGALLVRLGAPPVDGAANEALVDLLAGALGVAPRAITIVAGERSRRKRVRITGLDRTTLEARLAAAHRAR